MKVLIGLGMIGTLYTGGYLGAQEGKVFEESPAAIKPDKVSGDTVAIRIFNEMVNTMYNARTLSYESEYKAESENWRKKVTCKIMLKKPNYSYVEVFDENGKLSGILLGDGKYFWLRWPQEAWLFFGGGPEDVIKVGRKEYMRKPAPKGYSSIGHQLSILGAGLSILDPSVFHGYSEYPRKYADSIAYIGRERIGDEELNLIWIRMYKGQRVKCFWTSPEDHLPRRLIDSVRVAPLLITEERWRKIRINEEIPNEKFKWSPPEGWREVREPEPGELLIKPGERAPDFSLKSASGGTISLSDFRGKVVILFFWKVGCPPCREIFPDMQRLYEKFKDKGLVILGFDCVDDKKIALDYMREHSITFPMVLDASKRAWKVQSEEYGSNAFPTFFVIDREGKIVESIYGYSEEGYKRMLKALERLGIK